jgi:hypothetical protein
MQLPMRASFLFALVVAAGCGAVSDNRTDSGTGDTVPAGDFSLAVAPGAVTVPIASSTTVTVTVQRASGVGDIMLSTTGEANGVMVTYATNPLPVGTDTTEATIKVAGGSAATTTTVTITGTAGTKTHSADVAVTAQTITVSGLVAGGKPNITVGLVGKTTVTSDSTGHFTFTDVTPPYDLYTYRIATFTPAIGGAVMTPTIIYYDDLTRTDPVVRVAADSGGLIIGFVVTNGRVTGVRSGQGDNVNPSIVAWSNGNNPAGFVKSDGTWDFTAQWSGNTATNNGTLYGLQWTAKTSGAPDAYIGFGSANATIASTSSAPGGTAVNLNFSNPPEAALTGTITAPVGYPTPTLTLTQQWGNVALPLWTKVTTDAASSIVTGTALGKAAMFASSQTGAGETTNYVYPALTAATDVGFTMPAAAVQVSPIAAATMVDTTTDFQVTAAIGAVYRWNISTSGTNRAFFQIYSGATTIRIPSVTELPLPKNQSFSWNVEGFGPLTTNDAATMADVSGAFQADFIGTKRFDTRSLSRTFTSKP